MLTILVAINNLFTYFCKFVVYVFLWYALAEFVALNKFLLKVSISSNKIQKFGMINFRVSCTCHPIGKTELLIPMVWTVVQSGKSHKHLVVCVQNYYFSITIPSTLINIITRFVSYSKHL